jgi:hypothetical protein
VDIGVHLVRCGEEDVMERSLEDLENIVRRQVCKVCSDRKVDDSCGLEDATQCALFRLFPEVAYAIQNTQSDDIRDYVRAIRERVCAICEGQASDGSCKAREEVRCALDAYLLLIVDAIEEATGKKFHRPEDFVSFVSTEPTVPLKVN